MALSKRKPKSLTDTVVECNWVEILEADSDGLQQLFKPDDDSGSNIANHYQIDGGGAYGIPKYTHHLITLGIRQTPNKVILIIAHYTNGAKGGASGLSNPLQALRMKTSVAEVKKHEISVTKETDSRGQTILYFGEDDYDDSGTVIEDLLSGKVSRVRNIYYPQDLLDKQAVKSKVLAKIGTKSYKASSENCQHFVTEMLLGYGISDQVKEHYLFAPLVDQVIEIPTLFIKKGFSTAVRYLMQLPSLIEKAPNKAVLFKFLMDGMDDGWTPLLQPAFKGVSKATAALKATAVGAIASLAVEVIFFVFVTAYDYWCLRKREITSRRFANNLLRNISGSLGSIAGTLIGGFVGVFIPLPFGLGMMLGAVVGGFAGRYLGNVVGHRALTGGLLEDKIVERLERGQRLALPSSTASTLTGAIGV